MKVDTDKLTQLLSEKWVDGCPICQHKQWGFNHFAFEIREYDNGPLKLEDVRVMPLIVVACQNCHNTQFINGATAGLVELPK